MFRVILLLYLFTWLRKINVMIDISNWNEEELNEELRIALQYMALQYLLDADGAVMTRNFTIAGKKCLEILEALGKVETSDGVHYTWKEVLGWGN